MDVGELKTWLPEAEDYLLREHGLKWSRPTWYQYIKQSRYRLVGGQIPDEPGGRYWVYLSTLEDFVEHR